MTPPHLTLVRVTENSEWVEDHSLANVILRTAAKGCHRGRFRLSDNSDSRLPLGTVNTNSGHRVADHASETDP